MISAEIKSRKQIESKRNVQLVWVDRIGDTSFRLWLSERNETVPTQDRESNGVVTQNPGNSELRMKQMASAVKERVASLIHSLTRVILTITDGSLCHSISRAFRKLFDFLPLKARGRIQKSG